MESFLSTTTLRLSIESQSKVESHTDDNRQAQRRKTASCNDLATGVLLVGVGDVAVFLLLPPLVHTLDGEAANLKDCQRPHMRELENCL